MLRQTFLIMSHGYPKAGVEEVKELELRASFTQINSQHLSRVEFVRVCLVKPAPERISRGEKKFCSLIIDFASPKAANEAVSRGVAYHRQNITTKLYDRGARLRQCFYCQRYGHIAPRCRAKMPACGFCGGKHQLMEHDQTAHSSHSKCVNYNVERHIT